MVTDETRIRFTGSPLGRVIGGWMNISIKPEVVDNPGYVILQNFSGHFLAP